MEKQFNREDELMKRLLNEAGTERPSADLKKRIMMTVENRNVTIKPYQPLIPKFMWYLLAACLVSAVAGLYMMYADVSLSWSFDLQLSQYFDMPRIDLSRTMQYAIAFIALFFLQIPFLKRFLDREYRL
ncbi:hypothetical protein [Gramella sp. KN1008]|uniref:hypothetical protein n=1 Tax=Gramella sp. KN1008 TaxID=2529298 RepID=UPI00103E59C3|nr:hypothetical protein [Gramella sp. KN1008]TBW26483.1 hypothetical protein EZJ28_13845 [Gramella sp. KN1008]